LRSDVTWMEANKQAHYQAKFETVNVVLRLNDFPDENICTVFMGDSIFELEEFPRCWKLPGWK